MSSQQQKKWLSTSGISVNKLIADIDFSNTDVRIYVY